jgi:hypothetical protein
MRCISANTMVIVQRTVDTTAYRASQPKPLFGFALVREAVSLRADFGGLPRHTGRLSGCAKKLLESGYLASERNDGAQRVERNNDSRYWADTVINLDATRTLTAVMFDGSNPQTGNSVRCWSRVRRRSP